MNRKPLTPGLLDSDSILDGGPGGIRMSYIALHRIVEDQAKKDAEYRRVLERTGKPTLSHARKLTDSELLKKLDSLGIELDRESYAEIAQHSFSAEEIAGNAVTDEVRSRFKNPIDADWVWLALAVLWERWFPEWPNFEQLDGRIQLGYEHLETEPDVACVKWTGAWDDFWRLYEKGNFASLREFDEIFAGTQFVFNWISDFEMALGNAAARDPVWHERREQFCEEILRRFPNEDDLTRENMRRALGESVFGQGDRARGDALFGQWLKEDPQWGWGWIGWSDCYYIFSTEANRDVQRAEDILKQGLETPGVRDREDLLERMSEICQAQGRAEAARMFQKMSKELRRGNSESKKFAQGWPRAGATGFYSEVPATVRSLKIGRNDPCPCGSRKKYKKCCLPKDEERARQNAR